jgi:hypothetical protein
MVSVARTAAWLGRQSRARGALQSGGCLALAVASLALPAVPTYDPWAWVVFGRELVVPGLGFSTLASTGWKPLAVLFTAPLALLGAAAPSVWLVVVRSAGLAALALAFRLAARTAGPIAGAIAALALLGSSDWLRYLSAGNVEPLVVALMLGAIALHLRGRRGGAFLLGALAGLARPEVWLLVAVYAAYVWVSERRWWPLAVGVPGMLALWVVPDWLGSGDLLHTFHLARISAEPHSLQGTSNPALELVRGAGGIVPAPVWIGALCGVAFGSRARDRTVAALALVVAAWALPTVAGTALGYPAVPRYLVEPAAICCVLAGIGSVAVARLASRPRRRAALAAGLVAVSAPFAVSHAIGLAHQAADAKARAEQLSALWRAVDRAQQRAPVARLHPVVEPGALANGLAWKLDLRLDDVVGWFTPAVRIAFIEGDDRAVIARLRRRDATAVRLTAAGPWRVLLVRWSKAAHSARQIRRPDARRGLPHQASRQRASAPRRTCAMDDTEQRRSRGHLTQCHCSFEERAPTADGGTSSRAAAGSSIGLRRSARPRRPDASARGGTRSSTSSRTRTARSGSATATATTRAMYPLERAGCRGVIGPAPDSDARSEGRMCPGRPVPAPCGNDALCH